MKQQTAVGWLVDNIFQSYMDGKIYCNGLDITEEIEQAKQMEKEQIIDAFIDGEHQQGFEGEAQQYYNETYGQ